MKTLSLTAAIVVASVSSAEPIPVTVHQHKNGAQLQRGGKPYPVRGAGIEFGSLESFVAHGGNSFRTWRTDNAHQTGQDVLDEAHELGLTVLLCIEIGRERHGFDYDDEQAVTEQLNFARGEVLKYKDHPALLGWMIGNEPNLFFENPRVFDAINDISMMIHREDPHHPTTTALAGFNSELADLMATRASDVDFVSIQMYGDIVNLPRYLDEIGFNQPYMVTEWGAIGHWEVAKTDWGAPVEQNSTAKAENYLKSYHVAIAPDPNLLGSYVFLWGQKQERTPTWYGMFLEDGTETQTVDVMHYIWTGEWPENQAPRIDSMLVDGKTAQESVRLRSGSRYSATVATQDPDGDTLTYRWEILKESDSVAEGGDHEDRPPLIGGLILDPSASTIDWSAPSEPGAYRMFVYVFDGNAKAAHANIPFFVE